MVKGIWWRAIFKLKHHSRMDTMLVDVHCHVPPQEYYDQSPMYVKEFSYNVPHWREPRMWQPKKDLGIASVSNLLEELKEAKIDKVVVFGGGLKNWRMYYKPEDLASVVEQAPDVFIGFHSPDPWNDVYAIDETEEAVDKYGFPGVKIYPGYCGGSAGDKKIYPFYKYCEKRGLIVQLHTGFCGHHTAMMEEMRPVSTLDAVASIFPDMKIVLAHCGFTWVAETLWLLAKHKNMYGDLASVQSMYPLHEFARVLSWAKHLGVLDKIFYGSDYPLDGHMRSMSVYKKVPDYTEKYGLDPKITDKDVDGLLGNNAAKIYGLK